MARTYELECADCGAGFTAIRKNARYCKVCRTLRDALFFQNRSVETCIGCEKEYLPLQTTKYKVCGECNPNHWHHDAAGTCVFCDTETDKLLHQDVKVCRGCAEDPGRRELLIKALLKKRNSRCVAAS